MANGSSGSGGGPVISNAPNGDELPPTPQEKHYATIPTGGNIYISTQGDWWDLISFRVYGLKRNDDHLMHKLIEANYYLRNVSKFPAGVAVIVPPVPVKTVIPLVPWKRAYIVE